MMTYEDLELREPALCLSVPYHRHGWRLILDRCIRTDFLDSVMATRMHPDPESSSCVGAVQRNERDPTQSRRWEGQEELGRHPGCAMEPFVFTSRGHSNSYRQKYLGRVWAHQRHCQCTTTGEWCGQNGLIEETDSIAVFDYDGGGQSCDDRRGEWLPSVWCRRRCRLGDWKGAAGVHSSYLLNVVTHSKT